MRVKEGALQITATADDQTAIAQFVRLLQARGTPAPRKASIKLNDSPGTVPGRTGNANLPADSVNFTAPVDPARNDTSATPPSSDNLPAPGAIPAGLPRAEKPATPPSSENTLEPFPVPGKRQ